VKSHPSISQRIINMLPDPRRFLTLLFSVGLSALSFAASPEEVFRNPPDTAKPGVWWHWMGSNVSKEGITRDLEAFKKAGISGATIFGMADVCTPWAGHIENSPTDGLLAFTDPWWKLVRHAAEEGKRLGIDVGLHNCPGYTSTGGPWITPELSMQEIFQSQTLVEGGSLFRGVLPKPAVDPRGHMLFPMINKQTGVLEKPVIEGRTSYWRDIAVLAAPAEARVAAEVVLVEDVRRRDVDRGDRLITRCRQLRGRHRHVRLRGSRHESALDGGPCGPQAAPPLVLPRARSC
jgi:hypothetical protein